MLQHNEGSFAANWHVIPEQLKDLHWNGKHFPDCNICNAWDELEKERHNVQSNSSGSTDRNISPCCGPSLP